nr:Uvs069 [uncultured bacterium]
MAAGHVVDLEDGLSDHDGPSCAARRASRRLQIVILPTGARSIPAAVLACRFPGGVLPHRPPFEIGQDRAIRPVVSLAAVGEMEKRIPHGLHFGDFRLQLLDMMKRQGLHLGACPRLVVPKLQKPLRLLQRKAEAARPAHETQPVDAVRVIDPVIGSRAPRRRNQPDLLVIADHLGRNARGMRGFTDVHRHGLVLQVSPYLPPCGGGWKIEALGQRKRPKLQIFPERGKVPLAPS